MDKQFYAVFKKSTLKEKTADEIQNAGNPFFVYLRWNSRPNRKNAGNSAEIYFEFYT
jgi:hypothetical protein